MRAASPPSSASRCTAWISPSSTASGCSRISWRPIAPAARPIPTCCAIARSSSAICLRHAARLGGERLATGHYARLAQGADGPELHKARRSRQGPVLLPARGAPRALRARADAARASCTSTKCASWRATPGCRSPTSATAPASASSASGRSANSSRSTCRTTPGPIRHDRRRSGSATTSACPSTRSGSAAGIGIGGTRGGSGERLVRGRQGPRAQHAARGAGRRIIPLLYSRQLATGAVQLAVRSRRRALGAGITVRLRYRQEDQTCHGRAGCAMAACAIEPHAAATRRDARPVRRALPGRRAASAAE